MPGGTWWPGARRQVVGAGPAVASRDVPLLRRRPAPLLAVAAAVLLGACSPGASDEVPAEVVPDEERIGEVRAAREALATPVPALVAEAERLVEALGSIWTGAATARGDQADELRLTPLQDATDALDEVELEGTGPDVAAASELVDALVADARELTTSVEEEVATLVDVAAFDAELEELLAQWDGRGSYSQQLTAFDEAAAAAEELAARATERTATPACTGLWERRAEAATTVATRSEELRALVQDRRGQEFDELRDEFRQDPYDLGALLGELDADAASACWEEGSAAPAALDALRGHTDELAGALDPADLRG